MVLTLAQKDNSHQQSAPKHQTTTDKNPVETLDELKIKSDKDVYRCKTVFPFTLFPDVVKVDQNKVDIVYSNFFFSKSIFTILLEDIRTVKISTGPFFAEMQFEVTGYEQNPKPVSFLPKEPAIKMRSIIMGLATAKRHNTPLQEVDSQTTGQKAEQIGTTQEEVTGV